jgi:hypothetical protein
MNVAFMLLELGLATRNSQLAIDDPHYYMYKLQQP